MIRKIDHVGIATADIDETGTWFDRVLGLPRDEVDVVESQRVRVGFHPCSDVRFELLEATHEESTIRRHLQKRGPGVHHVAFEVDDIDAELKRLRSLGVRLIDESPRPGAHGTRIAFLHPKSTHGMLTELVERPGPK